MDKRGQLAWIEIRFFFFGLVAGLIAGLGLIWATENGKLGFKLPMVCGSTYLASKRAQLAGIEFHYFMIGLVVGIVGAGALVLFGRTGAIPFEIPLCVVPEE